MAKFYLDADGTIGLRKSAEQEASRPVPGTASNVVEFDEATNAQVVNDFDAGYSRFGFVAGVLRRDGVPVVFAAESNERTARREIKDQVNDRLDDVQAVIDGVDASNNAQLRTMVKTLARNQKRILRMMKGLL